MEQVSFYPSKSQRRADQVKERSNGCWRVSWRSGASTRKVPVVLSPNQLLLGEAVQSCGKWRHGASEFLSKKSGEQTPKMTGKCRGSEGSAAAKKRAPVDSKGHG